MDQAPDAIAVCAPIKGNTKVIFEITLNKSRSPCKKYRPIMVTKVVSINKG